MKVLLFSNLYPSERQPTRGAFNRQTFLALARYCEVRVVSPLPWWTRLRTPRDLFRPPVSCSSGIPASYPTVWSIPRLAPGRSGRTMERSVRGHVEAIRARFPFDAILAAWGYPDAAAAALLAARYRCPLITQVLGSDVNELGRRAQIRPRLAEALLASDHVVAVSAALRERVVELGIPAERVVVQHNGVDGERFAIRDRDAARRELGLPLDRRLILYVGNLLPEKGVDLLASAAPQLFRAIPNAEILFVGGGPLEGALRMEAERPGMAGRIRLCGRKLHDEIPLWMAACDLFCLPSRREGCPNVVLEALAAGRPVVAARVGGVPELIDGSNGALVSPDCPEELAQALAGALSRDWDPELLRATVPCLSWDEVGRTLHSLLQEAASRRRLPGNRADGASV
jgi:glycosyltransferase involved in cell wall biosynthesis